LTDPSVLFGPYLGNSYSCFWQYDFSVQFFGFLYHRILCCETYSILL